MLTKVVHQTSARTMLFFLVVRSLDDGTPVTPTCHPVEKSLTISDDW
jgi:hypothetical protein